MNKLFLSVIMAATALTLSYCSQSQTDSSLKIREMNQAEMQADFDQMVRYISDFYGPLEYKERRFGFELNQLAQEYRTRLASAHTDMEAFGIYREFLSRFQDGHVGIRFFNFPGDILKYQAPLFVAPYYDEQSTSYKVIVEHVETDKLVFANIAVGDEVVMVDGKPIMEYLPTIQKYDTVGYEETDRHLIYKVFDRKSYMTELVPQNDNVEVTFRNADGETYKESLLWEVKKMDKTPFVTDSVQGRLNLFSTAAADFNEDTKRFSFRRFGDVKPFYLNETTQSQFDLQRVYANETMLKKYGIESMDKAPDIYAAMYEYEGKNILLIRNPTYSPGDWDLQMEHMKHYRAILDQYDSIADVLVVDQTHNGGGSYCTEFAQLFLKEQGRGPVQANNADRLWIRNLLSWVEAEKSDARTQNRKPDNALIRLLESIVVRIETAIDQNQSLTEQLPFFASVHLKPDASYSWKKPLLVLSDELDGSCADIMPMLIKANGSAKIFGRRTMGLGGNVEPMPDLNISGASVRLTRGLFTTYNEEESYPDNILIENNGVEPDYEHIITVDDFRNGFTGYVEAFSKKAIEQID